MSKSRLIAILSLFVLSAILTACGTDNDSEPTAEPTAASTATATETSGASTTGTTQTLQATPTDERAVATPAMVRATPSVVGVVASTPDADATPEVVSVPATQSVPARHVQATFTLNGAAQQDYLETDEGCVGLGEWRGLQPGAQVIVRDASGTVVDIAELEASDAGDGCSWVADLSVPGSEFVSISVPMITDVWFSQSDLDTGMVEITLP